VRGKASLDAPAVEGLMPSRISQILNLRFCRGPKCSRSIAGGLIQISHALRTQRASGTLPAVNEYASTTSQGNHNSVSRCVPTARAENELSVLQRSPHPNCLPSWKITLTVPKGAPSGLFPPRAVCGQPGVRQ
jgi:hypothetical protein